MKNITQNLFLLILLSTIVAIPMGVAAMEKNEKTGKKQIEKEEDFERIGPIDNGFSIVEKIIAMEKEDEAEKKAR